MASARGIYTSVNHIRKQVFAEVARLSYNYDGGSLEELAAIPYKIIPGEESRYRESVFLERAIIRERLRLAMGLPLRDATEMGPVYEGADECIQPEMYYEPPLINIIKFACHKCPDNVMHVTDICQGCIGHPCMEVCPKQAISFVNGRSFIDQEKCIKCGKCMGVCAYGAIVRQERPCVKACGVGAIHSDYYGRAEIDQEKCVSCGQCLANCPFGAIADKAQIFQTIQAIKSDVPVYAALAPACVGQFGPDMTSGKIRTAFKELGFVDALEVAIGADLCAIDEAKDFLEEVPKNQPFMATSCCPAWSSMAKRMFPDEAKCISMALTPMVLTGRMIKEKHPDYKVAFIGPCSAKKLEAQRKTIRSDIDFVLTFEEVMGMFEAKGIDFKSLPEIGSMHGASADGRGFAVGGGVANAVVNCIHGSDPDREVKVVNAMGLDECKKLLVAAKAGKYDGYLLEGMACPGGCVAGVGTTQPIAKSTAAINLQMKNSTYAHVYESNYQEILPTLIEKYDELSRKPED